MTFTDPTPFDEAIDAAAKRKLLPTSLSSRELRELAAQVKERSVFSARTTNATYLQKVKEAVERILTPQTESGQRVGFSQMREDLKVLLEELNYDPQRGFPGDDALGVPPAEAGSLRDLGSDLRLNLMLETQVRQMLGAGYRIAGMDPPRLDQFPAWELVRVYSRKVERLDWERRWQEAGGEFFDGRMIARKDSDVWNQLGSTELFDDGLDNPFEPFAWGSGMGREEVPRDECEELGVIEPDESVVDLPTDLNASLEASASGFSPDLLAELERELGDEAARLMRNRVAWTLQLINDGTSEGARKGWESRRGGRVEIVKRVKAARTALRKALSERTDQNNVMHKPGAGQIDFDYGRPGNIAAKKDDGYGVSHMAVKHPDDLKRMPITVARGKIYAHDNPRKRFIVHKNYVAVIQQKQLHPRLSGLQTKFSGKRWGVTTHYLDANQAQRIESKGLNRRQALSVDFLSHRGYASKSTFDANKDGCCQQDYYRLTQAKIKCILEALETEGMLS